MAGNLEIGTAYLKVKAQADENAKAELQKSLGSAGTGAGDEFSAKFSKALGKITKFAAQLEIGKKLVETIAASVGGYADYEQFVGGVETLFKTSSKVVQEYAANAYKTAGVSANQYMETVTSFSGAILRTLGDDTQGAAELAHKAIVDMSDQANKYGIEFDRVKTTYLSLSRGGYAMLDNLFGGMFAGTKQGLRDMLDYAERYRASLGETVSYSEESYADIVNAIHDVSESLGVAGTTAQEAATTLSGAWNTAKAAFDNWLVSLADPNGDVEGATQQMMDSIAHVVEMAAPVIGNALGNLLGQLPGIIIENIPGIIEAITMLVLKMGESFQNGIDSLFTDFGNWVAKLVNGTDEAGDQMAAKTGEGVDKSLAETDRLISETDAKMGGFDYSDSGYSIGESLARGMRMSEGLVAGASNALAAAAHVALPNSPAKEGPFSGKGWTLYGGKSVAEAFAQGFLSEVGNVQRQITQGMGAIHNALDLGATTNNYNVSMSVRADSTTTLDSLVNQARRAKAMAGGW